MSLCLSELNQFAISFLSIVENDFSRPRIKAAQIKEKFRFTAHYLAINLTSLSTAFLLKVVNGNLSSLSVSALRLRFEIIFGGSY